MKKKNPTRLVLHRETLLHLNEPVLANVQGQYFLSAYRTCDVPCQTNEVTACVGAHCIPL